MLAAHLEEIREVRREPIRQAQAQRAVAEISHDQALVAGAVPDELHAIQMNVFPPQDNLAVLEQIRVTEVRREHCVVVLRHRGEQQRPFFLEKQVQLRQHARVAMIQALGVAGLAADVAAMIEHRESVAVLQRTGAALLKRRRDGDGKLRCRGLIDRI